MNWRTVVTLLLLAGAAISGWSLWSQRQQETTVGIAGGRPDYVLHDFELVALDTQGRESFTLRAPRLARDPGLETFDIDTPVFVIPPDPGSDDAPWFVRSRTAWVSADGDELRLRGDVRMTSERTDGRPVKVATEQLNVFPDERRATSAVRVTVTRPGFIMNGHDLDANLATDRISLLDTRSRYESTAR